MRVTAPQALARRLAQVGVVAREDGKWLSRLLLRPGQRLVSREGDCWRWDGFVAAAEAPTPAARRLAEKNRLGDLSARGGSGAPGGRSRSGSTPPARRRGRARPRRRRPTGASGFARRERPSTAPATRSPISSASALKPCPAFRRSRKLFRAPSAARDEASRTQGAGESRARRPCRRATIWRSPWSAPARRRRANGPSSPKRAPRPKVSPAKLRRAAPGGRRSGPSAARGTSGANGHEVQIAEFAERRSGGRSGARGARRGAVRVRAAAPCARRRIRSSGSGAKASRRRARGRRDRARRGGPGRAPGAGGDGRGARGAGGVRRARGRRRAFAANNCWARS